MAGRGPDYRQFGRPMDRLPLGGATLVTGVFREARALAHEVTAEMVLDAGSPASGRATVVRLRWRADDALAVAVAVTTLPEHPALPHGRWVILRDFLRYGLEVPTGDGDVRIRPADGEAIILELAGGGEPYAARPPGGGRPYAVRLPVEPVRQFLDATERLVPTGEERSEPALDALIEQLLDRSSD